MPCTRRPPDPARRIAALIPAHNEAATIGATIACLLAMDRPPDRLITVADRCTDTTAQVAAAACAEIFTTAGNTAMKAGALNQALAVLLPALDGADLVMVTDADTLTSPNFTTAAAAAFTARPALGGLSGVYQGRPGHGWVGWCQRAEFTRWGFDARQEQGKAICLSGSCSIYTVAALRTVITGRADGTLPGGPGGVYHEHNFTEDFELTQALKHAGWQVANLMDVQVVTAVKPTWRALHVQRLRWNTGITDTLLQYGLTRHTAGMWARWVIYTYSVLTLPLSGFLFAGRLADGDGWRWNGWLWLWLAVTGVIVAHKTVTIGRGRWWYPLAAMVLVVELSYDTFLHATFARSLWLRFRRTERRWR